MPTTFTNQATLSYNNQSIPSNVVTGVLTEVLSVSKTAIPAAYQNGDTITYAVQLVNSGTAALTGLTLTDNLGAYTPAAGTAAVVPMTYQSDTLRYYRMLRICEHPDGDKEVFPPVVSAGICQDFHPAGGCLLPNRCNRGPVHSAARRGVHVLRARQRCGVSVRCFVPSAYGGVRD